MNLQDANKEYKVANWGRFQVVMTILGLFIPMPQMPFTPDYAIGNWGFGYTISLSRHVPLGWVMLLLAILL